MTEMTLFSDLAGAVQEADRALIPVTDSAVTRGDGVFETILVAGGHAMDVMAHLERLRHSSRLLDMDAPPPTAWTTAVTALCAAWSQRFPGEPDFALRLTATRSGTAFATAAPIPAATLDARSGVAVVLAPDPFNRTVPYLTAAAKTLSYAVNMAALRHARSAGADDVIFVREDGTVSESPTATVVLVIDGEFVTPPCGPGTGILDSITARRLAPRHLPVTTDDLRHADGVYLVSSVRLAAPLTRLDGAPMPRDLDRDRRILDRLLAR